MIRRIEALALMCLCLCASLAGCSNVQRPHAFRLPQLHLAGLTYLAGVSNLASENEQLVGVRVFTQAGDTQPWALAIAGGALHMMRLDGSDDRTIATTAPCEPGFAAPSVAPDGDWVACVDNDYAGSLPRLELASLTAPAVSHEIPLNATDSARYSDPVWSPDGTLLAMLTSAHFGDTCVITIYRLSAERAGLSLALTLSVNGSNLSASDQLDCSSAYTGLGWSSDGSRLLIATQATHELRVDDHAPVARLLRSRTPAADIAASDFTSIQIGGVASVPRWNPRDGSLTFVSYGLNYQLTNTEHLYRWTSGESSVADWFMAPDNSYQMRDLAWTADGSQLVILFAAPPCVDRCVDQLADAYLFTPPLAADA